MDITQVAAEGLKREFRVTYGAEEIEKEVTRRLEEIRRTARIPGFRPGKVPLKLLRARYGGAILGEVLEKAVQEGTRRVVEEHELRPALRPKVEITSFEEGGALEFKVDVEVLPEVPEVDLPSIELVRHVAEVPEETVRRTLENLAEARRRFEPADRPAQEGDQVVIGFTGTVDGEPLAGGSGEKVEVVLGTHTLLPGFEEGLVGRKAGESFRIEVQVPEDHPREDLRGRTVVFEGRVEEVRAPQPVEIGDELAKSYGFETLADLEKAVRERFAEEYRRRARERMKRQLLDWLDEKVKFEVPQGMVDLEFQAIWRQLEQEMRQSGTTFEQLGRSREELEAEYRAIAERRVRLGLILSEIGRRNQIEVSERELQQAVLREAQRAPGREREVIEFFRRNPAALQQLQAPIFED
ncbi:Trigger factor [bacterium HR39]|nr:Trigger factor [bacterium HR39]